MRSPLLALALALLSCAPAFAATDVYIKLAGQGGADLQPLALIPFSGTAIQAEQLTGVVRDDLLQSRYFSVTDEPKNLTAGWAVTAKVTQSANMLEASVQLKQIPSGDVVLDRFYKQDAFWLRSLGHRIADDIVKQATGKNGIAQSRIAFANAVTGHKEIWIADYDGSNPKALTKHKSISLLPRFSPDRKMLAFTSYKDGNPDLFTLDLASGKEKPVSQEQGLNIAGGFSPDGTELLMTLSRQKSPNLYLKNFADGTVTQLTQHFGADSSPTFSPDSQQVAFVSDRSGNPQIYVLDMTTRRAKKLTGLNWCDSPSWSPTGEWIAFAGRAHREDKLDIYIVDVTGGQIRQLTKDAGANENPAWSPDGRFLVFSSTRNKKAELFIMDADGSAPHRLLDLPGPSTTPDWSR